MSHDCCDGEHRPAPNRRLRWLGVFAPFVACAFCPACLSLYASLLSALGVGLAISETEHHIALAIAVAIAVVVSAWRARREHSIVPFAVGSLGCAALVAGHAAEVAWLEWIAITVLLGGAWIQPRMRATEQYDRGGTWEGYRRIPSLTDYVLVSQAKPQIELYQRRDSITWSDRVFGPGEQLDLATSTVHDVDAIFEGVMALPGDEEPGEPL